MRYELINARDLSRELVERWSEVQASDPDLGSPYFCPEFTQAVAAVRDDVHVCVLEDGGRAVGFFPFHRRRGGAGRPVGLALSDYHGVIAEPDADWSVDQLLRASKLVRWEFDHLPVSQRQFGAFRSVAISPIIEVSCGYERYLESRDRAARKQIKEVERKRRKLEEACGPLRFIPESPDEGALRQLIAWKSAQCRSTGVVDFFALDWTRELLRRLERSASDAFGGQLSCLYLEDRLVAAHYGLRAGPIWHSWFPSYDREFSAWSPGGMLLLDLIKAAAADGVRHIDLGKGVSTYKSQFMTGAIEVGEGCAAVPSVANGLRTVRLRLEAWGRRSSLRSLLRIPGQLVTRRDRRERYA